MWQFGSLTIEDSERRISIPHWDSAEAPISQCFVNIAFNQIRTGLLYEAVEFSSSGYFLNMLAASLSNVLKEAI